MRNQTRLLFNTYLERVGELNHVDDVAKTFSVDPSVQQTLRDRMTESSEFLGLINVLLVDEQMGEALGIGVNSLMASRTDTTGDGERRPTDPTSLDADSYLCSKTDSDTVLPYSKLDAWAKFKDFQERIRNAILRGQALDRIRIGFNGVSIALNSNKATNPLGQDINKGWLQKLREARSEAVLASGAVANKVTYGTHASADYKTLDALVYAARQELIQPWHREGTDLVVITSSDLLDDKYFPLINQSMDPQNQIAADVIMSTKRLGKLPAYQVPFFPAGKTLITSMDNLSIYEQEGKRRRLIVENARKNGIENFESSNEAYVFEDLGKACLIENIELKNAA